MTATTWSSLPAPREIPASSRRSSSSSASCTAKRRPTTCLKSSASNSQPQRKEIRVMSTNKKTNALMILILATSALLTCAQEPKVINTQFHSSPAGQGVSVVVDRFRHSGGPLWLGYQVQALPRTHLSACSSWTGSSDMETGCCNELHLEDTSDNLNASEHPNSPAPTVYVLLRLDQGEVTRTRLAPTGCTLNAGGVAFEWLTGVQPEDSVVFLGKQAASAAALHAG